MHDAPNWPGGTQAFAPKLKAVVTLAEAVGFSSLSVMDHFFQIPANGQPEDPMLEAYTTLGFLAAATSRIQLGTVVTSVT
ncbi:MAG: LLM class flavin-dependent oxidoreductase, partial [Myxococcales bacterium]|nr:LLM class flavin-dependent oxidoreductase [Myxococcales bacterium]